jgi:hypothetical protein
VEITKIIFIAMSIAAACGDWWVIWGWVCTVVPRVDEGGGGYEKYIYEI